MKVRFGQSGYVGASMSVGATQAYDDGEMPASRLASALAVPVKAIRSVLMPASWHHVSKYANAVNFYRPPEPSDIGLICALARACGPRQRVALLRRYAHLRNLDRDQQWSEWPRHSGRARRLAGIPQKLHIYLRGDLSPKSVREAQEDLLQRELDWELAAAIAMLAIRESLFAASAVFDHPQLTRNLEWVERGSTGGMRLPCISRDHWAKTGWSVDYRNFVLQSL